MTLQALTCWQKRGNCMTAPCKGCQLREPGCHGKCEAYREYRAWKDEEAAYKALVTAGSNYGSPMIRQIEQSRLKAKKRGRLG